MQSETIVGLVANFEDTGRVAKMLYHPEDFDALGAIRAAFEAAGVEFVDENGSGPGVQLKRQLE